MPRPHSIMVVLQVLLSLWSCYIVSAQLCIPPQGSPNCVCDTPNGRIDLTAISQKGSPKFENILDPNGQSYSYNPCYEVEGGKCGSDGNAVCQEDTQGIVRSCGLTSTEQFQIQGNKIILQYDGGLGGRISIVELICDPTKDEPQLIALGDYGNPLIYTFELHTKCACPNAECKIAEARSSDISGPIGITLIVLFILAIPAYFISGAIILKFKFNKSGSDLIPQRLLWLALLGLIKDGCVFTFNPIIQIIKGKTGKSNEGTDLLP